jgi:hypothetical protein
LEPASRASAFREGFNNPPDYDDNQGFCGGAYYQNDLHNGECGICGDAIGDAIRKHEAPNKYANGIITGEYTTGQDVQVKIQVTANHRGYFIFKLCENNNILVDKDQSCFDQ